MWAGCRTGSVKLQQHHGQAAEDMRQIIISTEKIGRRAGRIDALDFSDGEQAKPAPRRRCRSLRLEAGE